MMTVGKNVVTRFSFRFGLGGGSFATFPTPDLKRKLYNKGLVRMNHWQYQKNIMFSTHDMPTLPFVGVKSLPSVALEGFGRQNTWAGLNAGILNTAIIFGISAAQSIGERSTRTLIPYCLGALNNAHILGLTENHVLLVLSSPPPKGRGGYRGHVRLVCQEADRKSASIEP